MLMQETSTSTFTEFAFAISAWCSIAWVRLRSRALSKPQPDAATTRPRPHSSAGVPAKPDVGFVGRSAVGAA